MAGKEFERMPYFVTSDNVKIYYEEKGEGKPIIFVHGWTATHSMYDELVSRLSLRYRCIYFDLRGCGASSIPRTGLSMAKCARDIKELIEYLDLDYVILYGISLGASVIYAYAEQYDCIYIERMIIGDQPPCLMDNDSIEDPWHYGLYRGNNDKDNVLKNVAWMFDDFDGYTFWHINQCVADNYDLPDLPEELKSTPLFSGIPEFIKPYVSRGFCANLDPYVTIALAYSSIVEDYRKVLPKITIPTAIFYPNPGSIYKPEAMVYVAEHLSGPVKLIELKPATHMFLSEHFNLVVDESIKFIEEDFYPIRL